MAITEKHLPAHLSKRGEGFLSKINEYILKQSNAHLTDFKKVIPKKEKDRLIQTFEFTIKGLFLGWMRKVHKETLDLKPVDKNKILLYLVKELKVQAIFSKDFPYTSEDKGGIQSKIVRGFQLDCAEKLREDIYSNYLISEKNKIKVDSEKGNKKIMWLGNKQQLENLILNLVENRHIKGLKNKNELTEIFLSHFNGLDQNPIPTNSSTKKLQLDLATGKIIGGILRELIYKKWILQKSHAHTKDRIAEVMSKILSGTTQKTIKNGMSMHFENDKNNPMAEVKDRSSASLDSKPFDKIKNYNGGIRFKQVESKF